MILLIDNYDSFSYNVYQLVGQIESDIKVIRNDELTVEEIEALKPSHIILSPGPGKPADAGICEEVVRKLSGKIPILGICLGHQAICEIFGANVTYAKQLMHGKQSVVSLDTDSQIFLGMEPKQKVARYHSLAADKDTIPNCLKVTAVTEDGEVMAVEHREYPVYGLQFHPESVLTTGGEKMMANFLKGKSEDYAQEELKAHRLKKKADTANQEDIKQQDNKEKIREQNKEEQIPKERTEKEEKWEIKERKSGQQGTEQQKRQQSDTGEEQKKMVIEEAIKKLVKKEDIGYEMAKEVMNEIMSGQASEVQKSSYLTALSMKGETIEEITGSAEEMRNHCTRLEQDRDVLEIVGTGGDGSNSFNISTTASLVISAAGVPVAKHGNRAASSKSGAADCLEALGVNITISPEKSKEILEKANICFLFAQKYHTAMKYVGPVRKELGIRTIFNILGPLANPASANMQVMGVYEEALAEPLAKVLSNLGVKRGMVVYGQDKLDEISVCAPTTVCEIEDGSFKTYVITPEEFGLKRYAKEELVGGTPAENAKITRKILAGEQGAARDAVVFNAAAGLFVAGKAKDLAEGVKLAQELIDTGKAAAQLEKFIELSNE